MSKTSKKVYHKDMNVIPVTADSLYLTMHQYVNNAAIPTGLTLLDEVNGLAFTPIGNDTAWTDEAGFFTAAAAATPPDMYCHTRRDLNTVDFDSVFNFAGKATLFAWHGKNASDPTATVRVMARTSLTDSDAFEFRYPVSGVVQLFINGTFIIGAEDHTTWANNEAIVFFLLDDRAGERTAYTWTYNVGTGILVGEDSSDLDALLGADITVADSLTDEYFVVGGRRTAPNFSNLLSDYALRRIRVINFGTDLPDDIADVIVSLAKNKLLAFNQDL